MDYLPLVSIIVPVYNGERSLPVLLSALKAQTYPKLEILIVDNNSTDSTAVILQAQPSVRYIREEQPGSYAARNAALALAKGEILAFTDDDCIPQPEWVSEGVRSLESSDFQLAGGAIHLRFSDKPRLAEWIDGSMFLNQATYVTSNFAVTANLFVHRQVFEHIGLFNAKLISSGDAEFCRRACMHGFRITYVETARVYHPTRKSLKALLRKAWRIGYGNGQLIAQNQGKMLENYLSLRAYGLPQPNFQRLRDMDIYLSYPQKLLCMVADYFVVILARNFGCVAGYLTANQG
ncbi:MAG: glycosyltransferase [Coleofasciculus sp. S288]|nr:glycosyltransferase [Coleofasciculus sp. S288]